MIAFDVSDKRYEPCFVVSNDAELDMSETLQWQKKTMTSMVNFRVKRKYLILRPISRRVTCVENCLCVGSGWRRSRSSSERRVGGSNGDKDPTATPTHILQSSVDHNLRPLGPTRAATTSAPKTKERWRPSIMTHLFSGCVTYGKKMWQKQVLNSFWLRGNRVILIKVGLERMSVCKTPNETQPSV